jgi:alkylated DNA nucleotide flippase Atl1
MQGRDLSSEEAGGASRDPKRMIAVLPGLWSTKGMTVSEITEYLERSELETRALLQELAQSKLVEEVPYRSPPRWRITAAQRRERVLLASQLVKSGEWTTYGDIAVSVFSSARVAQGIGRIAVDPAFANPHRVLDRDGAIRPGWRDAQGNDATYCRALLEREGVRFHDERADEAQRVRAQELRQRLIKELRRMVGE